MDLDEEFTSVVIDNTLNDSQAVELLGAGSVDDPAPISFWERQPHTSMQDDSIAGPDSKTESTVGLEQDDRQVNSSIPLIRVLDESQFF